MIKILLKKELICELRRKETLVSLSILALLLALMISAGLHIVLVSAASIERFLPVLIWVPFILIATVSISRTFEFETEHMALEGTLLSQVTASSVFVAKWLTAFCMIFFAQVLYCVLLFSLSGFNQLSFDWLAFFGLSFFVVLGFCSIAVLITAISSLSSQKGLLLPLLLLPLGLPLLVTAIELTSQIVIDGKLLFSSQSVTLLLIINIVYFLLSFNLFGFVLRE